MRISVIIPCLNEEEAISSVIADWKKTLPEADIWVCDNNSDDNTLVKAIDAGAKGVSEPKRGKGKAVKTLLKVTDYDIYVLSDGDGEISATRKIIEPILSGEADMVCGDRLSSKSYFKDAPSEAKKISNKLMPFICRHTVGIDSPDPLCGLKAFTKRYSEDLKLSDNFEIEIEMLRHAVINNFRVKFVPVEYNARSTSKSKIKFFKDGFKIVIKCFKCKLNRTQNKTN